MVSTWELQFDPNYSGDFPSSSLAQTSSNVSLVDIQSEIATAFGIDSDNVQFKGSQFQVSKSNVLDDGHRGIVLDGKGLLTRTSVDGNYLDFDFCTFQPGQGPVTELSIDNLDPSKTVIIQLVSGTSKFVLSYQFDVYVGEEWNAEGLADQRSYADDASSLIVLPERQIYSAISSGTCPE